MLNTSVLIASLALKSTVPINFFEGPGLRFLREAVSAFPSLFDDVDFLNQPYYLNTLARANVL